MSKSKNKTEVKKESAPAVIANYGKGEQYDKYAPRVIHTVEAWIKVQKCVDEHKGKASYKQLCDVLAVHFTKTSENHHDFIGYMVRRGSLVIIAS